MTKPTDASARAVSEPAGHWADRIGLDGSVTSTFIPHDRNRVSWSRRTSYLSDIAACLRGVRAQLNTAGPITYNDVIMLIDRSVGDIATRDELDGVALAVLNGARHVKGGAIDKLRTLMGA
jgi:hypothetical protein